VLPCRHEDILKVGFSRAPLRRLQTLHRRWFDFFDLDAALLVETDRVADARRIEQHFALRAAEHRAPSPLVVPRRAAGHTEWYRGASALLDREALALAEADGYRLHRPLGCWLRATLLQHADRVFDWSAHALRGIEGVPADAPERTMAERPLRDLLDAYVALSIALDEFVPAGVLDWYRAHRERVPLV
jgi:hypothetical protein